MTPTSDRFEESLPVAPRHSGDGPRASSGQPANEGRWRADVDRNRCLVSEFGRVRFSRVRPPGHPVCSSAAPAAGTARVSGPVGCAEGFSREVLGSARSLPRLLRTRRSTRPRRRPVGACSYRMSRCSSRRWRSRCARTCWLQARASRRAVRHSRDGACPRSGWCGIRIVNGGHDVLLRCAQPPMSCVQ